MSRPLDADSRSPPPQPFGTMSIRSPNCVSPLERYPCIALRGLLCWIGRLGIVAAHGGFVRHSELLDCGTLVGMHTDSASKHAVPVALCLGGLDPSTGAGILRDALTLWEMGVYPMAVPMAETVQNGVACSKITAPSLPSLERLEALRPHLQGVWGVKLGLCALPLDELAAVTSLLEEMGPVCRIWDPIQAPTSGVGLHDVEGLRAMARIILGMGAWVVSPNRPEATAFGALPEDSSPEALAHTYLEYGASAVWLKGGHGTGEIEDFWVDAQGTASLGRRPRLAGDRRGTGCTLASAWLGLRLSGVDNVDAARQACEWLQNRWASASRPGGIGRPSFVPVLP